MVRLNKSIMLAAALLLAATAWAPAGAFGQPTVKSAPPKTSPPAPAADQVTLEAGAPVTKAVGEPIVLTLKTTAKKITWKVPSDKHGKPLGTLAVDGKRLAVWALEGTYKFTAMVPAADDVLSTEIVLTVTGPRPPPVTDPDKPVEPPPVIDPPVPAKGLYFLIVRKDGPADKGFTDYMGNPGWDELRKAGHTIKDKQLSELPAFGIKLPPNLTLPRVLTIQITEGAPPNWKGKIIKGPDELPAPDKITDLANVNAKGEQE